MALIGEADDYVDLVNLLPSDPFEMNPENVFDPAANYQVGNVVVEDNFLDGLRCYRNAASFSSFESQVGYGDCRGGENEGSESLATSAEVGVPNEGLFYALSKLGVKNLLSVERVCKSLYYAVRNDPLLWRCIHVDLDFSRKITDDVLFELTQRAQGSLQCLSMPGCVGITDDGLKRVLEANPRLSKNPNSRWYRRGLRYRSGLRIPIIWYQGEYRISQHVVYFESPGMYGSDSTWSHQQPDSF